MKWLLLATTSLLLAMPNIALAQQQDDHHRGNGGRGNGGGRPTAGAGQQVRPARPGGPQIQPPRPGGPQVGRPQIQPPRPGGPQIQPIRPGGPQIQPPRPGRPGQGIGPGRPGQGIGFPHRPGTGRPPNFRPVRGPSFRYPHGYRYRRWSVGLILPSLFLSSSYYYNDWADLGVGPPPRGCRWVRYGPDLLLVRRRTGQIIDVIYGAFY